MRKRILVAAVLAMMALCALKMRSRKRAEWHGISETEARTRLDARIPHRIPEEKRAVVTDRIVAKMRERGVITDHDTEVDDTGGDDNDDNDDVDLRDADTAALTT